MVTGLWDSWEPDAFLRDRETGVYFDPAKLHVLDHQGPNYSVRGPLHVGPSPQGRPVTVVATASAAGLELAGEIAEIVFAQQQDLALSQAFYTQLKQSAETFGRSSSSVNLMPGINPIVGRTLQEAEDKHHFLQSKIHPDVGRAMLSIALGGYDVSDLPLDEPLPDDVDRFVTLGSSSTLAMVLRIARNENLTVRQLYERYAGARGQRTVIGTAAMIADQMEEWFTSHAVDGFLVQPAYLPGGLTEFAELVMPELRRRGLFKSEYSGTTLRANLGLDVPANRHVRRT